jgi:uncharacterized protein YycO
MITLYLTASRTFGGYAIQLFTWSKWSHIAIEDGDHLIEAHWRYGVRRVPKEEGLKKVSRMAVIKVETKNDEAVLKACRSQVGKPYDYSAILSFLIRRDWQEDDAWQCAELIAWAFAMAGEPIFRPDSVSRITPAHWWLVAPNRLLQP